jgi:RNA polymerase sigma-70 factor, ECF subfamily
MQQQLQEQPDSEVIRRIRSGDNDAFDELMRRYKRPVVNFVYRMLGSMEDADDVAQEVFVRVYQNLDTYRPETKFSTWLFA